MASNGGTPSLLPGLALDHSSQTKNGKNPPKRRRFLRSKSAPQGKVVLHNIGSKDSAKPSSLPLSESNNILSKLNPAITKVVAILAVYLFIGTLCFYFVRHQIKGKKTDDVLDSLYFCVITMTTVGYGDLLPNSSLTKLLACACVFSGMALGGLLLTKAADYLVEKQEELLTRALNMRDDGSTFTVKEIDTNKVRYKFLMVSFALLATILIGTVFLVKAEGMEWVNGFYCVVATITTLGYGDVSFQSKGGRVFAVFWIFSSTIIVALFFLYLTELYTERKRRALVRRVLSRKITTVDLEAADMDANGDVNAAEFIVYKLKEMGKVTQEDIVLIMEEFNELDVDQTGTLSTVDVNLAQSSPPKK